MRNSTTLIKTKKETKTNLEISVNFGQGTAQTPKTVTVQ